MRKEKIIILGAGIAGLSVALALKDAGYKYTIFEAAPGIKPVGAGLALGANAIKGFEYLGIADEVKKAARQLNSMAILDHKGKKIMLTTPAKLADKYEIGNYAIHRAALHEILIRHAGAENIVLGRQVQRVKQVDHTVIAHFTDGTYENADYIIAAEGIHSPVRQQLIPGSVPRFAGYTCWRGVIPFNSVGLDASETWGPKGRFGIVPLADNRVYWFACVSSKPQDPVTISWTTKDIAENFREYHTPIKVMIAQTEDDQLIHNDIYDIKPIDNYAFGNILLTGDAAHATTPNLGQGACQAVEDAACFKKLLSTRNNLHEVFTEFESVRLKRTHWIINRSRSLGALAQASNPLLTSVRNAVLRMVPQSVNEKQMQFLYNVDF